MSLEERGKFYKNFPTNFAFSSLGIGPKTKAWNWRKVKFFRLALRFIFIMAYKFLLLNFLFGKRLKLKKYAWKEVCIVSCD